MWRWGGTVVVIEGIFIVRAMVDFGKKKKRKKERDYSSGRPAVHPWNTYCVIHPRSHL